MKYRFRIWCEECTTVGDTEGCFGGRTEVDEQQFTTIKEACIAGFAAVEGVWCWESDVVDEDGKKVAIDEATEDDWYNEWDHEQWQKEQQHGRETEQGDASGQAAEGKQAEASC